MRVRSGFKLVALASVLGAAACGGGPDDIFGGAGGKLPTASATTTTGSSTATGMNGCPNDCKDDHECTVDSCVDGLCRHVAGPNVGPTACPPGQFCEVLSGCVPSMACATTQQCLDALGSDACKANIACNPEMAICTFTILDKDMDFHAPTVCGGGDCNDNNPAVFPGATEVCDGADNNCNMQNDDGATCGPLQVCQDGKCTCSAENICGEECPDITSDPKHCGGCNQACPQGAVCQNSSCVCSGNLNKCDGQCVDINKDPNHCGGCGVSCPGLCEAGMCKSCVGDLYAIVDASGSMEDTGSVFTKWEELVAGVNGYASDPASHGTGIGILFSPKALTVPTCVVQSDCPPPALCLQGICFGALDTECDAQHYAAPAVPITQLPGAAAAVSSALAQKAREGGSTPPGALLGALTHAKAAATQSGHNVGVVLFADGMPNVCVAVEGQPDELLPIASQFANGAPSVKTYVVALGAEVPPSSWNVVAAAGGTGVAYASNSGAQTKAALDDIRERLKVCP